MGSTHALTGALAGVVIAGLTVEAALIDPRPAWKWAGWAAAFAAALTVVLAIAATPGTARKDAKQWHAPHRGKCEYPPPD